MFKIFLLKKKVYDLILYTMSLYGVTTNDKQSSVVANHIFDLNSYMTVLYNNSNIY